MNTTVNVTHVYPIREKDEATGVDTIKWMARLDVSELLDFARVTSADIHMLSGEVISDGVVELALFEQDLTLPSREKDLDDL